MLIEGHIEDLLVDEPDQSTERRRARCELCGVTGYEKLSICDRAGNHITTLCGFCAQKGPRYVREQMDELIFSLECEAGSLRECADDLGWQVGWVVEEAIVREPRGGDSRPRP